MTQWTNTGRGVALAIALVAGLAPAFAQSDSDDGPGVPGRRPPPPAAGRPGPGQPGPGQPGPGPQAQPERRHHRDSGVGAAIGAGLVGGIVGGALLNGQRQVPDYPPPPVGYAPPPPTVYETEDEPECRVVRKPVYDEDGEVVSYRTRRVCR